MKTIVGGLAVVLMALLALAPAYGQQQTPKGTEGPDIRKVEPKGTEGPDVRKQEPKGTEGPDVRKTKQKTASSVAPKPKVEPKGVEGPDVRRTNP